MPKRRSMIMVKSRKFGKKLYIGFSHFRTKTKASKVATALRKRPSMAGARVSKATPSGYNVHVRLRKHKA